MENITGIVSEYNPFHEGHAYHIKKTREIAGEDAIIICCMSGDFVQRGEWAIMPKHDRAGQAVKNGADIVVELPVPWALSSAEGFAEGGVQILSALGITHLSFGSEAGDIDALVSAAREISADGFNEKVKKIMKDSPMLSYPAARAKAFGGDILDFPNNALGVEYIKAIIKNNLSIRPVTVKRESSFHGGPGSASDIRDKILSGERCPGYADYKLLNLAAVSRLRSLKEEDVAAVADSGNGAGNRLLDAVRQGYMTVDEICLAAKTKSITYSRLKRIAMRAVLGIDKASSEGAPPYVRILAVNARGRAYLSSLKKNDGCALPVITHGKEANDYGGKTESVFALGAKARDFYNLGFSEKSGVKAGEDYRIPPVLL